MPEDTDKANTDCDDDNITKSTRSRWEWTGTILALALILSLTAIIGLAGAGMITLSTIPQSWFALYSLLTLTAGVWVFGKEALEAVQGIRGN